MTAQIAAVHLVRRGNDPHHFESFITSYERHAAGRDHELVLLFKGFEAGDELEFYRRRAAPFAPREVRVGDDGADLHTYLAAAASLPHERLCLLNSYVTIESSQWLSRLSAALDEPGVGAVGASGSWASNRSLLFWRLRLPNGYGMALADRRRLIATLGTIEGGSRPARASRAQGIAYAPITIAAYPGFPAPHVRTNGLLIDRELLLSLRFARLRTKRAAHRFEAGRMSILKQLERRGLATRIVGCDGRALDPAEWADAEIFWQGNQGNLLIADNQTRAYNGTTTAGRDVLARLAWGSAARS
jgi:hypothetical protein